MNKRVLLGTAALGFVLTALSSLQANTSQGIGKSAKPQEHHTTVQAEQDKRARLEANRLKRAEDIKKGAANVMPAPAETPQSTPQTRSLSEKFSDFDYAPPTSRLVSSDPVEDTTIPAVSYQAPVGTPLAWQTALAAALNAPLINGHAIGAAVIADVAQVVAASYADFALFNAIFTQVHGDAAAIATAITAAYVATPAFVAAFTATGATAANATAIVTSVAAASTAGAVAGATQNAATAAAAFGVTYDTAAKNWIVSTNLNGANPHPWQISVAAFLNLAAKSQPSAIGLVTVNQIAHAAAQGGGADYPLLATLYNTVVGKADAAAIGAAFALPAFLDALKAAGATNALAAKIQAFFPAAGAAAAGGAIADATTAAAAFGVTYDGAKWIVSIPCGEVLKTGGVLHFHQGDYDFINGFFIGMDQLGSLDPADPNREYALSRVTRNQTGKLVLNPLAPHATATNIVTINAGKVDGAAASNSGRITDNPLFAHAGQGLSQLILQNGCPVVALNGDPAHVYELPSGSAQAGGKTLLALAPADLNGDWVLKDAAGANNIGYNFDVAVTNQPVKISATAGAGERQAADQTRNAIFVAGADKKSLKTADVTKIGVSAIAVQTNYLEPLQTNKTNDTANPEKNIAAHIDLAAGKHVAANTKATFVNDGNINLWWDDRYGKLFGTLSGLAPATAAAGDAAFGLFQGGFEADKFVLNPMVGLAAVNLAVAAEQDVANSVFGAAGQAAGAALAGTTIDLTRPRTLLTSTNKDYLLVTGGVNTKNTPGGEQAWVNALPLIAPHSPVTTDDGKLAKSDFSGVLGAYAAATTPHVNRQDFKLDTIDKEQTPYVVGRYPGYLAQVGLAPDIKVPGVLVAAQAILPSTLAAGSVVTGAASVIGATSDIVATAGAKATVTFAEQTPFQADTTLKSIVTQNINFDAGTEFAVGTKAAAEVELASGALNVAAGAGNTFTAKAGSILTPGSVLGATTQVPAAKPWTFDYVGQAVPADTTVAVSRFGSGSALGDGVNAKAFGVGGAGVPMTAAVGHGSQVTLNGAVVNKISANAAFIPVDAATNKVSQLSNAAAAGVAATIDGALQFTSATPVTLVGDADPVKTAKLGDGSVLTNVAVAAGNLIAGEKVTLKQGAYLPNTAMYLGNKAARGVNPSAVQALAVANNVYDGKIAGATTYDNDCWFMQNNSPVNFGLVTGGDFALPANSGVAIPSEGIIKATARPGDAGLKPVVLTANTVLPPFTLFKQYNGANAVDYATGTKLQIHGGVPAAIAGAPDAVIAPAIDQWIMLDTSVADAGKVTANAVIDDVNKAMLKITPDGVIQGASGADQVVLPMDTILPRYTLFQAGLNVNYAALGGANITGAPAALAAASAIPEWHLNKWTEKTPAAGATQYFKDLTAGIAPTPLAGGVADDTAGVGKVTGAFAKFDDAKYAIKLPIEGYLKSSAAYSIYLPQDTILPQGTKIFVPANKDYSALIKDAANVVINDLKNDNLVNPVLTGKLVTVGAAEAKVVGAPFKLADDAYIHLPPAVLDWLYCQPRIQGDVAIGAAADLGMGALDNALPAGVRVTLPVNTPQTLGAGSAVQTGVTLGAGYDVTKWSGLIFPRDAGVYGGTIKSGSTFTNNTQLAGVGVTGAAPLILGKNWQVQNGAVLPRFTLFDETGVAAQDYTNAAVFGMAKAPAVAAAGQGWYMLNWTAADDNKVIANAALPAGAHLKIAHDGIVAGDAAANNAVIIPQDTVLPPFTLFKQTNAAATAKEYAKTLNIAGAPDAGLVAASATQWVMLNSSVVDAGKATAVAILNDAAYQIKIVPDGVIKKIGAEDIVLPKGFTLPGNSWLSVNKDIDLSTVFSKADYPADTALLKSLKANQSCVLTGNVSVDTAAGIVLPAEVTIQFPASKVDGCASVITNHGSLAPQVCLEAVGGVAQMAGDVTILGGRESIIRAGSVLAADSTLQPAFVVGAAGPLSVKDDSLKVDGGVVSVLGGSIKTDGTVGGHPLLLNNDNNVSKIAVGAGGFGASVAGTMPLVATLAAGSSLGAGSIVSATANMPLPGVLAFGADQLLNGGSKIAVNSIIANDSEVTAGMVTTDANTQFNDFPAVLIGAPFVKEIFEVAGLGTAALIAAAVAAAPFAAAPFAAAVAVPWANALDAAAIQASVARVAVLVAPAPALGGASVDAATVAAVFGVTFVIPPPPLPPVVPPVPAVPGSWQVSTPMIPPVAPAVVATPYPWQAAVAKLLNDRVAAGTIAAVTTANVVDAAKAVGISVGANFANTAIFDASAGGGITFKGNSSVKSLIANDTAGVQLSFVHPAVGLTVGATDWKVTKGSVTLGANAVFNIKSKSTLDKGSNVAAGSIPHNNLSTFGFSASDMQVIGDSVYLALEGDRAVAGGGVESGVFKSTAVFDTTGGVRGWTPWHRMGGTTDATAFFGYDPRTSSLTYLTSPDGKGIIDNADNTVLNPATVAKLTTWQLDESSQLGAWLNNNFKDGIYGLFDFDPQTRGFAVYNVGLQPPQFACMVATGDKRVAIVQTGAAVAGGKFEPTAKYNDPLINAFVFDAKAATNAATGTVNSPDLADLGKITCAEWTRNVAGPNWLFVGGENGLAVLHGAAGVGVAAGLAELTAAGFPGTGFNFKKLAVAGNANLFANVRRIVADEATGFVYVTTKTGVFCINPTAGAFVAANLLGGDLATPAHHYVELANYQQSKAYNAGNAGNLLGDGEFTDVAILKSAVNATKDTTLLLATTNGLFTNAAVIQNTFAGDVPSLIGVDWNAVKTSNAAAAIAPYQNIDLNARAGLTAAAAAPNVYDGFADAVTTIIGSAMGYAMAPAGAGFGGLGITDEAEARHLAYQVALQVGIPSAVVTALQANAAFNAIAQADAAAIFGVPAISAAMIAAATAEGAAAWATYDATTKAILATTAVLADIQARGSAAGSFMAAAVALVLPVTLPAVYTAARAAITTIQAQMPALLNEMSALYGDVAAWINTAGPDVQRQAGAGLKTVLRLEPVNLQGGGRLVKDAVNVNDYTFEGDINVYATDNSNSELRLYRLSATGGVATGIAEATCQDALGKTLPYFARLGSVEPALVKSIAENFFLKTVDQSALDNMVAIAGGVPALINPDTVAAATVAGQMLDAGGDYTSSLMVPQLNAVLSSASGALYIPMTDGVLVND